MILQICIIAVFGVSTNKVFNRYSTGSALQHRMILIYYYEFKQKRFRIPRRWTFSTFTPLPALAEALLIQSPKLLQKSRPQLTLNIFTLARRQVFVPVYFLLRDCVEYTYLFGFCTITVTAVRDIFHLDFGHNIVCPGFAEIPPTVIGAAGEKLVVMHVLTLRKDVSLELAHSEAWCTSGIKKMSDVKYRPKAIFPCDLGRQDVAYRWATGASVPDVSVMCLAIIAYPFAVQWTLWLWWFCSR